MAEVIYPWPRFLAPRDGVIDLSDGGFLRQPRRVIPARCQSRLHLCRSARFLQRDASLSTRVFESEKLAAWKNGSSHLFLHLDSLDEALVRIDSIANLLASELPGIPTDRLSIRIACRTAVWPADTLGAVLKGTA